MEIQSQFLLSSDNTDNIFVRMIINFLHLINGCLISNTHNYIYKMKLYMKIAKLVQNLEKHNCDVSFFVQYR